jgi:glycosyltransferase involved in cell wall biosynthesis
VICLNRGQVGILAAHGIAHVAVIHHGYNERILRPVESRCFQDNRKFRIGFFSKRYDRRFKGEALLYELAKRLDPSVISFTLVGEGRSHDALELQSLGYETRVFERLPYQVFGSLYASIDALLMISNFEGGPANLPEAVATGTPIICLPVGMAPDVVTDGDNGLVLCGDPDADAARILALAHNESRLVDRLFAGASRATERAMPWSENIARFLSVYADLTSDIGD